MQLQGKKIIQLVHNDFEDLELWYPALYLRGEGATVDIIGEKRGKVYEGKHGVPVKTDYEFSDIDPSDYDAILVPGGWAPDKLRRFEEVKNMLRHMDESGKLIGIICHAGWVPISAGIINGREVTSTHAIKDDLINAGAQWKDEAVVVDNNLVSSRRPPDLPFYMKTFTEKLAG